MGQHLNAEGNTECSGDVRINNKLWEDNRPLRKPGQNITEHEKWKDKDIPGVILPWDNRWNSLYDSCRNVFWQVFASRLLFSLTHWSLVFTTTKRNNDISTSTGISIMHQSIEIPARRPPGHTGEFSNYQVLKMAYFPGPWAKKSVKSPV